MQLYISTSATFSQDAVYWNSLFSTANLVFTVTLFIYHLVINSGVFRFKFPAVHGVVQHSENHSIKHHEQKFRIKFAFQSSIEQTLYRNMWKLSFWGINKNVNSSTEFQYWISKNLTLYDLLFLIAIYSPNSYNKHHSEMIN